MQVHQGHFSCGENMKVDKLIGNPFALFLLFGAGVAQAQVELPTVTVTATREEEKISETPISVGVVPQQSIQITKPTHPLEILGQVPGVSVSVTNGEGHQTAIRQGFTTSPVYLFLEDGIPIRATGNFNHNALYEVNIPGAGGIEVIRGPGSALHGSDAIGGIVNVITKMPKAQKGRTCRSSWVSTGIVDFLVGLTPAFKVRARSAQMSISRIQMAGALKLAMTGRVST